MRPKNTKDTKWIIYNEQYFPTKTEAKRYLKTRAPRLPSTLEDVGRTRTPFGTFRRATIRTREFWPRVYKGKTMHTAPMTKARAHEVKKYHPTEKLVKIKGAYYYL